MPWGMKSVEKSFLRNSIMYVSHPSGVHSTGARSESQTGIAISVALRVHAKLKSGERTAFAYAQSSGGNGQRFTVVAGGYGAIRGGGSGGRLPSSLARAVIGRRA